jgi:hypothetical protein
MKRNQAVRAASYLPIGSIASFANYNLRSARSASSVELRVHASLASDVPLFVTTASTACRNMFRGQSTAPWASRL